MIFSKTAQLEMSPTFILWMAVIGIITAVTCFIVMGAIDLATKRSKIAKSVKLYESLGFKKNDQGYWIEEKTTINDITYARCMKPTGEFGILILYNGDTHFVDASMVPTDIVISKIKACQSIETIMEPGDSLLENE